MPALPSSEFFEPTIDALLLAPAELVEARNRHWGHRHWGQVDTCQFTSVDFRISLDDKYRPGSDAPIDETNREV